MRQAGITEQRCAELGAAIANALPCGPWTWKQQKDADGILMHSGTLTRDKDGLALRFSVSAQNNNITVGEVWPDYGKHPVTGAWRCLSDCTGRRDTPDMRANFAASRCDDPKKIGVVASEIKRKVITPWAEALPVVRARDAELVTSMWMHARAIREVAEIFAGRETNFWDSERIERTVRSNSNEAHLGRLASLHAKVRSYGTLFELRIPNANAGKVAAALAKIADDFDDKSEG